MDNYSTYYYTQIAITCIVVPILFVLNIFQWYCERFQSSVIPDIPKTIHRLAPVICFSFVWSFFDASASDSLHFVRDCIANTTTVLEIYGLICIVYFTLAAVYRSNRFEEPKTLKKILNIFPFATLIIGITSAALTYSSDRLWYDALGILWYVLLIVVAIGLIWHYTFRIFALLELAKHSRTNSSQNSQNSIESSLSKGAARHGQHHAKKNTHPSLNLSKAMPGAVPPLSPGNTVRTLDAGASAIPTNGSSGGNAAVAVGIAPATATSSPATANGALSPASPTLSPSGSFGDAASVTPRSVPPLKKTATMHTSQKEFRRQVLKKFRFKLGLITIMAVLAVGAQIAAVIVLLLNPNRVYADEPAYAGLCFFLIQLAAGGIATILAWQPVSEEYFLRVLYTWTCRKAKLKQLDRMEKMEKHQKDKDEHQRNLEEGRAARKQKQHQLEHQASEAQLAAEQFEKNQRAFTMTESNSNEALVINTGATPVAAVCKLDPMPEGEEKEPSTKNNERQQQNDMREIDIDIIQPPQHPPQQTRSNAADTPLSTTKLTKSSYPKSSSERTNTPAWFATLQRKFSSATSPPPPPPPLAQTRGALKQIPQTPPMAVARSQVPQRPLGQSIQTVNHLLDTTSVLIR